MSPLVKNVFFFLLLYLNVDLFWVEWCVCEFDSPEGYNVAFADPFEFCMIIHFLFNHCNFPSIFDQSS